MVKDGWVYCPICNNKTRTKIRPDTVARNLPVFCPKCKNVSVMDLLPLPTRTKNSAMDVFIKTIPKMTEARAKKALIGMSLELERLGAEIEIEQDWNVYDEYISQDDCIKHTPYLSGEKYTIRIPKI